MRHPLSVALHLAITLPVLPLLLPAFAPAAGPPPAEKARTFRQVLTTRPAPRLDDLAERAAPERQGDVASESFWDLLKLRDNPRRRPALQRSSTPTPAPNRIHRFASPSLRSIAPTKPSRQWSGTCCGRTTRRTWR